MKRTLHPRPFSKFDNRVEQAAEGLNQGCVILLWLAFFAVIFMYGSPAKSYNQKPRVISELQYLGMVASGGAEAKHSRHLSESELRKADETANANTPESFRHTLKCNAFVAAGF